MLSRGQIASLKEACRSKKATAPCSNSGPMMPSVRRPRPSSCLWGLLLVLVVPPARRPVGEVEDTRGKGLRVHEFQGLRFRFLVEEAFAAAHEDRVDHELELVEEPVAEQRPDEGRAAGDHDVLAWPFLELR